MINLLQENIEMESPRENSTSREIGKSYFLPTLEADNEVKKYDKI
jgi:hypothetical protein